MLTYNEVHIYFDMSDIYINPWNYQQNQAAQERTQSLDLGL